MRAFPYDLDDDFDDDEEDDAVSDWLHRHGIGLPIARTDEELEELLDEQHEDAVLGGHADEDWLD